MKFVTDITHRDGKGSSKKLWFNVACLAATVIILWAAYKDTFEDYAFICLFATYLVTVGGFEVIPKILGMILEFKTGRSTQNGMVDAGVEVSERDRSGIVSDYSSSDCDGHTPYISDSRQAGGRYCHFAERT